MVELALLKNSVVNPDGKCHRHSGGGNVENIQNLSLVT